ncbi:DUF2806 domain-containing protein [Bradyrhizobium cosmicum]|uniref:Nitrogenase molybdenum-iron protein alpha n=1 Tax=Bradyrhizobium cosmicum TaxID=1404864 RepID=A0AAI8QCU7_9BRAD|nr:DUF2806 domain-containing protein [Bradyrhizobium cosmicum]BAL77003.1 nitrogenase molybdenum-iron protein alpha [Bradyrhizobium cosmicum]
MPDNLPAPPGENPLPTMTDWIASWLGFQLPSISMPQTVKNLDKAVGKIILAAGENAEARIKSNTGKAKAKGKIAVDGLYRTDEEKRKLENRAATLSIAVDELNQKGLQKDAENEIEDDWLNLYAKIAEDKTSEELQSLFGKILAGEIQRPGTYSLRTLQFLSTLSKSDAQQISNFFSFVVSGVFVPIGPGETPFGPSFPSRILMEELGLASQPNTLGGLAWNIEVAPKRNLVLSCSGYGLLITNQTERSMRFQIECQVLTTPARELFRIANPPPTDFEFLKAFAQIIFEKVRTGGFAEEIVSSGTVGVQAGALVPTGPEQFLVAPQYKASMPGQPQATG